MATKFSQIYKQELKSKGILSSLGSAALKQRKERMDIRNVLFGGSGVVSATGQKIFGKGFSALGGAPAAGGGTETPPEFGPGPGETAAAAPEAGAGGEAGGGEVAAGGA